MDLPIAAPSGPSTRGLTRQLGSLALAALSLGSAIPDAFARELYVSPAGTDSASGTRADPLSVQRALDRVPEPGATDEKDEIIFLPGRYFVSSTLVLTRQPSPDQAPARPLKLRSLDPGKPVVLHGALTLEKAGFKPLAADSSAVGIPAPARSHVLRYEIAPKHRSSLSTLKTYRYPNLLNDGNRPLVEARWPNSSYATIQGLAGESPFEVHKIKGDKRGKFELAPDRQPGWLKGPGPTKLCGYWFWDWSYQCLTLDRSFSDERFVSVAPPEHGYGYRTGQRYFVSGVLTELDEAGEWYVDVEQGTVYLWPRSAPLSRDLYLPVTTAPLLKIAGLENVTLENLEFSNSLGDGVVVENSTDITLTGIRFRFLGGDAATVMESSQSTITKGRFFQIGKSAITLNGGSRERLEKGNLVASDNVIESYGTQQRAHSYAIRLAGVGNQAVSNSIEDSPHQGIQLQGNDHLVQGNALQGLGYDSGDAGAIYIGRDWTERGNVIAGNYIRGFRPRPPLGGQAIYLDDLASGVTIESNVLDDVDRGVLLSGGRDNIIRNNIIRHCREAFRVSNAGMMIPAYQGPPVGGVLGQRLAAMPYQSPVWVKAYPRLATILLQDPLAPEGNVIEGNTLMDCPVGVINDEVVRRGDVSNNHELPGDNRSQGNGFKNLPAGAAHRTLPECFGSIMKPVCP